MLKLGILGLGQAGTNIAEYALTKGFKAVVANTAKVDLEQAKYIPSDNKIYLGGIGAGRERQIGIEAIVSNADAIYSKCSEEFKDCDAVFVAASGGGGTGSGALPVGLDILMNFHKYVGTIMILPDEQESPKSKMNTLECFSQISQFHNLGSVFIIDNEKAKKVHPTFSKRNIFDITNKQIIDFIYELNALTDKPSYVSNFDAADMLGILQERGYTLISKVEYFSEGNENIYDIAKKIRESWSQNYQPNFNGGQITKGALLGMISEKVSSKIDVNIVFQEIGIPYDFNDVYFKPEDSMLYAKIKNTFYTILSGLSFPEDRLNTMNDSLKNIEDKLVSSFNISQTQKFESEQWSNKFNKKVVNLDFKNDKPQKINLLEKLAKYK